MAQRTYNHKPDKHPLHTKDPWPIGSYVRCKRFVERVGYDTQTDEQRLQIMKIVLDRLHIPHSDVILRDDGGQLRPLGDPPVNGYYIDWRYFPSALEKMDNEFGMLEYTRKGCLVPTADRPSLEVVKEKFRHVTAEQFKSGVYRKVFYTDNPRPDDVFVVVGKEIAKTGKYHKATHSCGDWEPAYLYPQQTQHIYHVKTGLIGAECKVHVDDLIMVEYLTPYWVDKEGKTHNWRVNNEWDYEKRRMQLLSSDKDERFRCPKCQGTDGKFHAKFTTTLIKPWSCFDCDWEGYKEEFIKEESK